MSIVDRFVSALVASVVVMAVLVAVGPTVIEVIHALVWLVLVVGLVGGLWRLISLYTNTWR